MTLGVKAAWDMRRAEIYESERAILCRKNSVSDEATMIESSSELRVAIADAEMLVRASGSNLNMIIQTLDQRLLTVEGDVEQEVASHIRPDIADVLDLQRTSWVSGQQLAARILCCWDDRIRVPLLLANEEGLNALVPVLAVTVFDALKPVTLSAAGALAALVVTRGLSGFCRDMGQDVEFQQLT
jgi:hypothetical protein